MTAPEKLSRLTPKTTSLEQVGHAYGSLTQQDIAAALAGRVQGKRLSLVAYLLVLRKFCDQTCVESELFYKLLDDVCKLAVEKRWNWHDRARTAFPPGLLRRITYLALYEETREMRCEQCKGRGTDEYNRECRECRGATRKRLTDGQRAWILQMDRRRYSETWKKRYQDVRNMIAAEEGAALYHFSARLK